MAMSADLPGHPMVNDAVQRWAASGAMALTGRAGEPPLGPPERLVRAASAIAEVLRRRTAQMGRPVTVDPLRLVAERAAIAGFTRRGDRSCGGATRLLRAADGWAAVSLARPDDIALVPAWLRVAEPTDDELWPAVARAVAASACAPLVARAAELGMPVARLGEQAAPDPADLLAGAVPVRATQLGSAPAATNFEDLLVVDLGSLWAGPLCGSLLVAAGMDVVKVESTARPDGARSGPPEFFDLMNAGTRSVALDLRTAEGASLLRRLIERADVVIEASRPRALEHLGIDARALLSGGPQRGPRVWISITGHGREGAAGERVAFGDDAAVAGGLVCWDEHGPCFCADAIADPLSGLAAAAAAVELLTTGGRWLVDVALAEVAAHHGGPTLPVPADLDAEPSSARPIPGRTPALGEHTETVLAELGLLGSDRETGSAADG